MERNENGFSGYNFTRGNISGRSDGCPRNGGGCQGNTDGCPKNSGHWQGNGMQNGNMNGGNSWGTEAAPSFSAQLAMVYSPCQSWRMLYTPDAALMRGTLFEELDKPLEDCVNG